jgi:Flp pilus assembly protein TadB
MFIEVDPQRITIFLLAISFGLALVTFILITLLGKVFLATVASIITEDNEMFVTSVNILRETGGNLAETFDTIVAVIRERVRLQLKIDTCNA